MREVNDGGPEAANAFMRDELKINCTLTRVKLLADIKCAANHENNMLQERAHQRALEAHRAANTTYAPTVDRDDDSTDKSKDRQGQTPRVHYAPKIPEYDAVKDLNTGADTFQVFGKALGSWIEGFDTKFAQAIDIVMNRTGNSTIEEIIESLDKHSRLLDTQLGAHLFSTAPKDVQRELYEDSARKLNGRTSSLVILSTWLDHVDGNSKKRIGAKLTTWLTRTPTKRACDLHADLNALKRDMGGMSRIGFWTENDEMFSSLVESALDKMVATLYQDPALNKDLATPYTYVIESSNHNIPKMIAKLTSIARDLTIDPSGAAPSHTSGDGNRRNPAYNRRGGSFAVGTFDPSKLICLVHRELGKCSRQGTNTCQYNHGMRSGKLCSDAEYKKTGICSDFRACTNSHPWDDKVFGPVANLPAAARLGKAQRLYLDIAAGKVCSLAPAVESMRMEMPEPLQPTDPQQPAINVDPRAGRGNVSAAQQAFNEERARLLIEDIDEGDFGPAVLDDDLSDATVHTSQEEELTNEESTEEDSQKPEPGAQQTTGI
jgi:hypothetical protein